MIKKLCVFPGCSELAVDHHNYCEKHLKQSQEKRAAFQNAKRTNQSLYNSYAWRKLRQDIIKNHPWCSCCGSTDNLTVDHITPPKGNQELFYDPNNLQVLCLHCHNQKTSWEIRQGNKKGFGNAQGES